MALSNGLVYSSLWISNCFQLSTTYVCDALVFETDRHLELSIWNWNTTI